MKLFHKLWVMTLVCLIPFSGCNTEALTDLNINPTVANELDWKFIFTQGLVTSAENRYVNWRSNLGYCSTLMQHMSAQGGISNTGDKYLRSAEPSMAVMDYVYENAMKHLAEVMRQTGPEGANPEWVNLHQAAQVMYIVHASKMTDMYGNVPYSEANRGVEGIFFPKYDGQQAIYTDMLAKLETAANAFDPNGDQLGNADIIFGGDVTKWERFANSLMLRLALRVSNVDAAMAESYVKKAIAGGVMQSNEDMAYVLMATGPSDWLNKNGISRAMNPSDGGSQALLSKTMVDFLKDKNDPRLMIYSGGIGPFDGPRDEDPATQQGMPNGYDSETIKDYEGTTDAVDIAATYSRLNPLLLDSDEAYLFQTYAEVELMLAEAALKGWGDGDVKGHYEAGVRAAMQMWTLFDASFEVLDTDVDTYLAANPFMEGSAAEMIAEQYWAATFLNWWETWSNYRRTGLPVLVEHSYPGNASGGKIFRRFEYLSSEVANNPNFSAGATLPDEFTTKVWWDK